MMLRFLLLFALGSVSLNAAKVGLCVMATGKYVNYAEHMITSARTYFCPGHEVTFFVFTDGTLPAADDTVVIFQKRLGWPHDTLMRFAVYLQHREQLQAMDYLFACDADMLFVDTVGDEILSERVATQHPGFVHKRGTYETKKHSQAYVGHHEGSTYFAGGFYGGSCAEFFKLLETVTQAIECDLQKNYIAVWHDESHLNRYFIDHRPTTILNPSYCYPESWKLPYKKKLLALDKNHADLRA